MTFFFWEIKNEEIFDNKLDSHETKTIIIRGLRLPLRGGGYSAQAQLLINVYPSQDSPTSETLWIFSGSSTASANSALRTSGGFSIDDSWISNGNVFNANSPTNQTISLSPLFSSASNPIDIESIQKRIPGGARTQVFAASATNTPTITIASGSRTIANLWMSDNGNQDNFGIRVSGSSLSYSSGNSSAWVGSGILNKPIGDFFAGTFNNNAFQSIFAANSGGSVRVVINSQVIPEPEEYALVFGLFALGFVLFRRHFQKKKRRQQTATS